MKEKSFYGFSFFEIWWIEKQIYLCYNIDTYTDKGRGKGKYNEKSSFYI